MPLTPAGMFFLSLFCFLFCVLGSESPNENRLQINRIPSETLLKTFEIEKSVSKVNASQKEASFYESIAMHELEDIISSFKELFTPLSVSSSDCSNFLEFWIVAVKRSESSAYPFNIFDTGIKAFSHAIAANLFIRLRLYYPHYFTQISYAFLLEYISAICQVHAKRQVLSAAELNVFKDLLLTTIYTNEPGLLEPLLLLLKNNLDAYEQKILVDAFLTQEQCNQRADYWRFIDGFTLLAEHLKDTAAWDEDALMVRLAGKPELFLVQALAILEDHKSRKSDQNLLKEN